MTAVSVIIPTYNRASFIRESIQSVLSQDYEPVESVVVDDGSTDDTEAVVRDYRARVRFYRQENAGVSVARNLGILRSTGDYLMFLDSDDLLLPGAIRKLAEALDKHPECGASYCGFIETFKGEVVRRSQLDRPSGNVLVSLITEYSCIVHSVMVRRECLARAGLFDPRMRMFEDMDFNVRLAAATPFVFVPEHLVEYRLSDSQTSKQRQDVIPHAREYVRRLETYRRSGLLNGTQWQMAMDRVYGVPPGRRALWDAYEAEKQGRRGAALRLAFAAAVRDPRYLASRTWISFTAKTALRRVGLLKGGSK